MTRLIASLSEISDAYEVLFCDVWGVLHDGLAVHPSAEAALSGFRARGGKVVLLTNAPRPAASVAAQILRLGAAAPCWDVIATSGEAAQHAMLQGAAGPSVHHIGAAKDEPFFEGLPEGHGITRVPLAEATGLVVTGLHDEDREGPEDYRATLTEAAARGLPLLCANPDIVVDIGERRVFCAGALAQLYEELGGTAIYPGKPFAPIYDLARTRIGAGAGTRILAIGDGPATDAEGARRQGLDLLFVTGGLAAAEVGDSPDAPDPDRLDAWLAAQGQSARYAIGILR